MAAPFPGMDPYIERADIWPDFHDRLITYLCAALQPLLRPRYAAVTQERLYVVESERPIRPDVSIVASGPVPAGTESAAAVVEVDAPAVFELWREELREPLIHIIAPATGRVVTAIEVLIPDNKAAGSGRDAYLKEREEYWASDTNLVEIDLLRAGESTVRVSREKLESLRPWHYLVTVTRRWPSRQEVDAVPLAKRLPRISIPLAVEDADVPLDLQSTFTQCWDEGPYPEILRHEKAPPGTLDPQELNWCHAQLKAGGFRT